MIYKLFNVEIQTTIDLLLLNHATKIWPLCIDSWKKKRVYPLLIILRICGKIPLQSMREVKRGLRNPYQEASHIWVLQLRKIHHPTILAEKIVDQWEMGS